MQELPAAERQKQIEQASIAGIVGNGILAALGIGAGLAAGSYAVVGAGLDSSIDIVTSLLTLLAARIASKPPDHKHPYGHGRAETIATKVLSFIIFFAGAELAYSTAVDIIVGKANYLPSPIAFLPVILALAGKPFLAYYKRKIGRRVESPMLIADARNMLNDVVVSGAVLLGLVLTRLFSLRFLDSAMAIGVSLWIIKVAFTIFWETNSELMEGIDDPSVYREIFAAVSSVEGAHHPHRTRVRKINTLYVVDLDVEVDASLTVEKGHDIGKRVEKTIKESIDNIYDVIVHIEPLGNVEHGEKYGLSRRKLAEPGD
ncbi:MAG TPA: cation diffusion facilitator family transporter [Spirochaetia bacterium]|nr:cation diffusion facilitator family transporter [Spirochaetia bacterium]